MAIILIILQIIGAIPTLLQIIRLIIGLLNKLPSDERKAGYLRLKDIVLKARRRQEKGLSMAEPAHDLEKFLAELKVKCGTDCEVGK